MRLFVPLAALALTAVVSLGLFLHWSKQPGEGYLLSDLRPLALVSHGQPTGLGNLVGLETRLLAADYQSPARLQLKFRAHLQQAREAGLLRPDTIVVLPEHSGTGLFAVGEKLEVQQARTLRDAMHWMALSNPGDYLGALLSNRARDRRTEAVLRMKAVSMTHAYQQVFGELAREFQVTLVAGSIVLPEPRVENGKLLVGRGPLREVAVAFDRSGRVVEPLIHKHALSRYERRYSVAADTRESLRLATPTGSVRVHLGCPDHRPPRETGLADVIIGSPKLEGCWPEHSALGSNLLQLASGNLPWNLLGSPHRPGASPRAAPGRLLNLWLEPAKALDAP